MSSKAVGRTVLFLLDYDSFINTVCARFEISKTLENTNIYSSWKHLCVWKLVVKF